MTTELDLADLGLPINLKSEIESKLKELDVYIDEELPDYILVLLANKKSQAQMCKDLRLFFGSLTETFVDWVHVRVKDLKIEQQGKQKEIIDTKKNSEENSNTENKSKHRRLSTHSEKSDTNNQSKIKSPLNSPKTKNLEISSKENSSLRKRRSRTPEPIRKSKPRIHQEDYLTSSRRSYSTDKYKTQQNNTVVDRQIENKEISQNTRHSNRYTTISSPPESVNNSIQTSPISTVTSPVSKESRVRDRGRGRDRQVVVQGDRREDKRRIRSRSTPISPTLRKSMEDHHTRHNKPQPKLRYFNRSPSSPTIKHHSSRKTPIKRTQDNHQQLSSVVRIKPNRDIRAGRSITIQDEQKGSIRLVHKALNEAAASTARGFPRNPISPRKRRGVMDRLGPHVDNSDILSDITSPDRKRNAVLHQQSFTDSIPSQHRMSLSDSEADISSRTIDPIKAQFDVIKLSRTDSACYISDDDLFPPRQDSPKRRILSGDIDMFDTEEVLETKRRVLPIKKPTKPKFIVTLDGAQTHYRQVIGTNTGKEDKLANKLDIKQRLGIKANELPEEITTPLYTPPDISPLSETLKTAVLKPKILTSTPKPIEAVADRCKYWPNCKLGDKCDFHHPSLPCKSFPYCKFNQKCYFIHPDCKFDPYCTKVDCAFLHRHVRTNKPPNHFKNTFSYTPDSKSTFPARSQLTWTPGQKIVKDKEDEGNTHISERKFALEEVQTVSTPKTES
ncbi:Zinc finger CCCH domain-containing protein 14 isoform X3 [Oopsacas minuta]|uniref:Zinc finger CCCH domain-containing protein 14 n=1 Tax=Oopsacas minuta TaxID=111878 RepID=A0AAV7KFA0_9METZ|nr:Zinc finger CCCH domain-containing protein 14 isoform X3 [Oopsacas minuta]